MIGFDHEKWKEKLYQKFPIDFAKGISKQLGKYIKTTHHRKGREFQLRIRRKANPSQLNALIATIESKTPPFEHVQVFIKRKVWEEITNLNSLFGLKSFVSSILETNSNIHLKLTW